MISFVDGNFDVKSKPCPSFDTNSLNISLEVWRWTFTSQNMLTLWQSVVTIKHIPWTPHAMGNVKCLMVSVFLDNMSLPLNAA